MKTKLKKGDFVIVKSGKFINKIDSIKNINLINGTLFLNSLSFLKKGKNKKNGKFFIKKRFIPLNISKVSYFSKEKNSECRIKYNFKIDSSTGKRIKERIFYEKRKLSHFNV